MAKKVILMKFLQEIRGYALVTNRRPAPRPPALFLMQLRKHRAQTPQANRPQPVAITASWQTGADVALPIRINHLRPRGASFPQ